MYSMRISTLGPTSLRVLNIHNEYFENILGALSIQFGLWIFSQAVGLRWIQNRIQNIQTEFPLYEFKININTGIGRYAMHYL